MYIYVCSTFLPNLSDNYFLYMSYGVCGGGYVRWGLTGPAKRPPNIAPNVVPATIYSFCLVDIIKSFSRGLNAPDMTIRLINTSFNKTTVYLQYRNQKEIRQDIQKKRDYREKASTFL